MKQAQKNSFFSIKEQEQVLMNIIAQRRYEQVVQMSREGYKITSLVLETLYRSGQKDTVIAILKNGIDYEGDTAYLEWLVKRLVKENELYPFIAQNALSAPTSVMKQRWGKLCETMSVAQLVENKLWDMLIQRRQWEVLAENNRFDDIIKSRIYSPQAVDTLKRYKQIDRIIELREFNWLTMMDGTIDILLQYRQFNILYDHRTSIKNYSSTEVCKKIFETPGGADFLYEKDPCALLKLGQIGIFLEKKNWEFLACHRHFDEVDWKQWEKDLEAAGKSKTIFLLFAEQAKRWDILVRNKEWFPLLKNKQFLHMCRAIFGKNKGYVPIDDSVEI